MKKLMLGAALGWLAACLLDPVRGRARRAQSRDRPRGAAHPVEDGKVVLRGVVGSHELIDELTDRACDVQGVCGVENLLHTHQERASHHV